MSEDLFEQESLEITPQQLKDISLLANQQILKETEVEVLEQKLKSAKAELRRISEVNLPTSMSQAGLKDFTLENGRKVQINTALYASIPQKNKRAAIQWLEDNGHGQIVSEDVYVPFRKGEHDKAEQVVRLLHENEINAQINESVNTATIKALIKELQDDGRDVPLELFGAYWRTFAKVV